MTGDRRDELCDLRDRLIAASRDAAPNELPGLSRELRLVLADLETLEDVSGAGIGDELDRKRAERLARSEAAGS